MFYTNLVEALWCCLKMVLPINGFTSYSLFVVMLVMALSMVVLSVMIRVKFYIPEKMHDNLIPFVK